jgi:hypothetical protein
MKAGDGYTVGICIIFLLFRRKNNKKHQNNGVFSKKGQVKKITALVINFTA